MRVRVVEKAAVAATSNKWVALQCSEVATIQINATIVGNNGTSFEEKKCNLCKAKGNQANMCWKGGGGGATRVARGSGSGGVAKPIVPAIKPKLWNLAMGT